MKSIIGGIILVIMFATAALYAFAMATSVALEAMDPLALSPVMSWGHAAFTGLIGLAAAGTAFLGAYETLREIGEFIEAQRKDTIPAGATFMEKVIDADSRREPIATEEGEWTLWVSHDCGSNYDPEVTVKDPAALHSRLKQLDEEGLRWALNDHRGNPHPKLMCRVHRGIIGSLLSMA